MNQYPAQPQLLPAETGLQTAAPRTPRAAGAGGRRKNNEEAHRGRKQNRVREAEFTHRKQRFNVSVRTPVWAGLGKQPQSQ